MVGPKNGTKDLLLSIAKNCETLIRQAHKKPEETWEFKLTRPRETFLFNPSISIKRIWDVRVNEFQSIQFYFRYNT